MISANEAPATCRRFLIETHLQLNKIKFVQGARKVFRIQHQWPQDADARNQIAQSCLALQIMKAELFRRLLGPESTKMMGR